MTQNTTSDDMGKLKSSQRVFKKPYSTKSRKSRPKSKVQSASSVIRSSTNSPVQETATISEKSNNLDADSISETTLETEELKITDQTVDENQPKTKKKPRVYAYDKDHKPYKSTPIVPVSKPTLSEIVPGIDDTLIDLKTLDKLSRSRYNRVAEYLTKLNAERHHHPRLQDDNIFTEFEQTLITVNSQKNILFSIDIEAFERKSDLITEIGVSIYDPLRDATSLFPNLLNIHILVKEHLHLRNGSFVNENKDNFLGGSSIILPLQESMKFVQTLVEHYFIHRQKIGMHGVVVGHAIRGDLKWLKSIGVTFPNNVKSVDSQRLYTLTDTINRSSLGAIMQRLNIPHSHLHNGGNDAYFTLVLLMKLSDPNFRKFHNLDSFHANEEYRDLFLERSKEPAGRPEKKAKKQKISEFVANTRFNGFEDALHFTYEK